MNSTQPHPHREYVASLNQRATSLSKEREDLEQQLVRNHRHRCRSIDQRSNHRDRRDRALHP